MSSDGPDISVIVVNWNAGHLTAAALASIEEHVQDVSYELILVDNGSTRDDSATMLPQRFPSARFIANPRNLGFSAGNNQGIAQARGRYVLLLNNDTLQTQNAFRAAVRYMDAHPEVGALGIAHQNGDANRSPQPSAYTFPRPWRELAVLIGVARWSPPPPIDQEGDVDWVCGSFLLIRRECLAEVGPLDTRFFLYDEDIDWCRRASRAGWKIRFWPGASLVHLGSATRHLMKDKTFVHFRSHLAYIRKHHTWVPATLYYFAMLGRLTLATVWQLVRWLTGAARFSEVRERSSRQLQFALLRDGRRGV